MIERQKLRFEKEYIKRYKEKLNVVKQQMKKLISDDNLRGELAKCKQLQGKELCQYLQTLESKYHINIFDKNEKESQMEIEYLKQLKTALKLM